MTATRVCLTLPLLASVMLFQTEPRALARADAGNLVTRSRATVESALGATSEDHAGASKHTNHLIHASSPYLLQHAHNPVDWYEWSDEAFERAQEEGKPVFLSIGYAACHWCHVMAHESFENEQVAAILNENFVCIKVDREERPDVDEIYMAATTAQTGRGGWPMSVFMTPDKKPFFCGTYFPREDGRGRRGFLGLCRDMAKNWKNDRAKLVGDADSLLGRVRQSKRIGRSGAFVDRAVISRKADALARSFDDVRGGRRSNRNKFPPTMAMELMLREYVLQEEISKPELIDLVELTLTQMARGGIYDQIGGGICRYSTDPRWFAPHFEKMLYDQATVAGVYLSAFQATGNPLYAATARSIFDYCLRDLQDERGGFYSSRDADSEGHEGTFYVWRRGELIKLLGETPGALFCDYYNVTDRGNWHGGQNILHVTSDEAAFARQHGLKPARWQQQLAAMKRTVFAAREKRIPPGLDDKILTEWNGMFISALARAYRVLDEPRYLAAATGAADFILTEMVVDGRLYRAHRKGRTYTLANAADYANLIDALITLFETTGQRRWLTVAEQQSSRMIDLFHDRKGNGFFYTASDAEQLLVRSKNARDGVVPSCNSVAAMNFMRLSIILNRPDWRSLAEETMAAFAGMVARGALERMQWVYLFDLVPPKEIAIIGDPEGAETKALIEEVYHRYLPNKVVMIATPEAAKRPDALPLIQRKTLVRGKPGAYVCRDYKCGLPVNTPEALARQLDGG